MTTSRLTIFFTALAIVCPGTWLAASQTTPNSTTSRSLFYDRQVAVTTLGISTTATPSVATQQNQSDANRYTGASSSSASPGIARVNAPRSPMAANEQKKIVVFREQQEEAAHKEKSAQLDQQTYAKQWLQAALSQKQQLLAKYLASITGLPLDLAKLTALYEIDMNMKINCECTLTGHKRWIERLTVLPDGRLASISHDNIIKIWNTAAGECERTLKGHTGLVTCLAGLSGGRLASGSVNHTIKIWNTNSTSWWRLIWNAATDTRERTLTWHTGNIYCLTELPDGRLASGSRGGSIKIWDTTTGECERTLKGHTGRITCLAVLPDGRLASGSVNHIIKIWNTKPTSLWRLIRNKTIGRCVDTCECTLKGHTDLISCFTVLLDGRLVSGSNDGTIRIWNTTTGNCDLVSDLDQAADVVTSLTVLPDGRLASGSRGGSIKIWNTATGKCERTLKGHTGMITCLAVLPDGWLASGSDDWTTRIWSTDTGTCECRIEANLGANAPTEKTNHLAVLPDGRFASHSGGADGTISIQKMELRIV